MFRMRPAGRCLEVAVRADRGPGRNRTPECLRRARVRIGSDEEWIHIALCGQLGNRVDRGRAQLVLHGYAPFLDREGAGRSLTRRTLIERVRSVRVKFAIQCRGGSRRKRARLKQRARRLDARLPLESAVGSLGDAKISLCVREILFFSAGSDGVNRAVQRRAASLRRGAVVRCILASQRSQTTLGCTGSARSKTDLARPGAKCRVLLLDAEPVTSCGIPKDRSDQLCVQTAELRARPHRLR